MCDLAIMLTDVNWVLACQCVRVLCLEVLRTGRQMIETNV